MQQLSTLAELSAWRKRQQGHQVALIPTMGNLHEGHLSLIDMGNAVSDRTIASIFVNPTQFGPTEDFASYPRTLEDDLSRLEDRGCDAVFTPAAFVLYPYGIDRFTTVDVPQVGQGLCDAHRPGHFRGVTSVVCRLFNAVSPQHAVFGQKDYQQLQTIRRMAAELLIPITIHAAPIAREPSGLAMSSRNGYLTGAQKQQATSLHQTLRKLAKDLASTPGEWLTHRDRGLEQLRLAGLTPEYLELRDAHTLLPLDQAGAGDGVILVAAVLEKTRLIDNLLMSSRNPNN